MLKVIGAGAIGMLLSAYLTEAGFRVQLVTRRPEQAETLNRNGLTRIREGNTYTYPVAASTIIEPVTESELMIIAVKSNDLKEIEPLLSMIDDEVPLLFVQNGLSHLEFANRIEHKNIAFGSIEHGALKINDYTVEHTGVGVLRFALYRGDQSKFDFFFEADQTTFPIRIEKEAKLMLLRKTILNSLINPLTAILQVKNGDLLQTGSLNLMGMMYTEIMEVFPEMMESITFEQVVDLCHRTSANNSSMLTDRLAGRKTEIESITGSLLRMAEGRGADIPSLRVIHMLMKAIEEGGDPRG